MDQITITLDGIEVSGHPGATILQLAREIGVEIPTLCYDSHLSPLGACRICQVEDEKSGRMLASCVTPISPGMVINTRSERVLAHRRTIIELILASHPDSCIVCDKGNRCLLRTIAADLGVGLSCFEKIPFHQPMVDLNPFIQRDMSKCIRCGRCIRADQEIAVVGAIDYTDRGFESRPATLLDAPLEKTECNFCGICISVCPTGALMERIRPSTLSATDATRTTCSLCGAGCGILLEHRGNRVTGVCPAMDEQSVNHVSLCVKGHYGMDFIHSNQRIKNPMIRTHGELVEVSWNQALANIIEHFADLKKSHGGHCLGAIGASHGTNEENYLLQKLVRNCFGSDNIDSGARFRGAALYAGIETVLGDGAMTNPISNIRDARDILVIGADPLVENPILGQKIKQAVKFHNAHLTLVCKLPGRLSDFAASWLRPMPGMHGIFLAGLLRELMIPGCPEPLAGSEQGEWFQWLAGHLEPFTREAVEKAAGIPAKLLTNTARRIAGSRSLAVVAGAGLACGRNAFENGVLLGALVMLTGNIGKPGCGLFPIAGSFNDQGAIDMGASPDRLPGGVRNKDCQGLDYLSMIEGAESGALAGLYVVGEDPVSNCPEPEATINALSNLRFLVVQDSFMTETAKLAHVVLPASTFAEKSGTWTSQERKVQRISRAISPLHNSRPDWEILRDIIGGLGADAPWESPDDVLREINRTAPGYGGITPEVLDRESIFRPCRNEDDPGTPILWTTLPSSPGMVEWLNLPDPEAEPIDETFPLWLVVSGNLFHSADGAATAYSAILQTACGNGHLLMNPFDAGLVGLPDGGKATVSSAIGSLELPIALSKETPRGIVMATQAPPVNLRPLFNMRDRDPRVGTPWLHRVKVKVEVAHVHE